MSLLDPSTDSRSPRDVREFEAALLHFINETLPRLDRSGRTWPAVGTETPLFVAGLLDSLSILHLIALIEELTSCAVPDRLVVMKHFQSVSAITATFWPAESTLS